MDPTAAPPPSATTTNHFHSIESNTDSWGEDTSLYQSNYGSSASAAASLGSIKLRLMCSNGGHIVPRPHDKSLCYVGGETHMVVVDRPTTLLDLTHRLSKTILRSSSPSTATSTAGRFTLKYQLPSEDLDSLISVTTDEDLENMIEEYERLNSSSAVSKSSRLRLFIFPAKPESVSSIGSFLENSTKSEDWFLNALNGTTSGFSDTSSVNNLLGLDDEISLPEKKEVNQKGLLTTNLRGNNSGQDVHSIPDSPMMETTSSFGSASSTPSQANLPPITVNVDDHPKVGGGIEEQFSQMSVQQRHHKDQDGGFVAAPAPVAVSGSPMSSATAIPEHSDPFLSYHERSEQGLQMAYLKQQQFQQKQSTGSILSDITYQEPVVQIQSSSNNNRIADPNDTPDQNPRIQMQQQQQQNQNSAYLMSMPTTKADAQHPQLHHQQQLQFIHTAVPQPQYIHRHHPPGVVPVASYYQMYQSPAMDQQNFVYYMPTRQQPPQGYNFPLQQQHADSSPPAPTNQAPPPATTRTTQAAPKTELPVGVYRTTNSGGPQLIQVASGHQHQPQYVGFHHPSQSAAPSAGGGGGNFGYEFTDSLQQGHRMYYATPPQSAAQYQPTSPIEASSQQSSNNR